MPLAAASTGTGAGAGRRPAASVVVEGGPASRGARATDLLGVLWVLSRKNFVIRYKNATLGVAWAVAQPAVQAGVLAVVFGVVFRRSLAAVEHYPLYVLSGVLPWSLLAQCLAVGAVSVTENASLVKKVALPKVVYPFSAVGGNVLAFLAALPVLVVGALLAGTASPSLLLLGPALALLLLLLSGPVLLTAGLHPAYRDVRFLAEAVLLVLFYATPVIWPASLADGRLGLVVDVNPVVGALDLFRAATLGGAPDGGAVLVTVVVGLLGLAVGLRSYRRRCDEFPDLL